MSEIARRRANQQVVKVRRDYNTWVANETLEDYALRYTPRGFRKWSLSRIANTALGTSSFLVLEAIGGTIALNYGANNALWAILIIGLIIFLTGLPISYYAARYGVDMDLLTRGSGFGYIGSTITSFVYASFTFILFALEASIMAYALQLGFGLPLSWAYLICAFIVVPLVTHGITQINRFQLLSQPVWLLMMLLPLFIVFYEHPTVVNELSAKSVNQPLSLALIGAAVAVGMALVTQIGEQVDYLRFMPPVTSQNRKRWLASVVIAGPGWVIVGVLKMVIGVLLACLLLSQGMSEILSSNPVEMYLYSYSLLLDDRDWAILLTVLFVCISQIKINLTNAYAGSLAWSNFFARLTHSHPGRVVWVIFNTLIALMLMQLNLFELLEQVLGLYANIAIAWIAVVVADLVINKPLGLSPAGIEFRRAYLYDINPVGVGAMLFASLLSVTAFMGGFGETLKPASTMIALTVGLITSPLIAWLTKGKYYLARQPVALIGTHANCCICGKQYEVEDIAHCPAYRDHICSLCCTLDARCNDVCKPRQARLSFQVQQNIHRYLPRQWWRRLQTGLGHYLMLMGVMASLLALLLMLIYYHQLHEFPEVMSANSLFWLLLKVFVTLLFLSGMIAWWLVLSGQSRRVAQQESQRQTGLLMREIEQHYQTDLQLQAARQQAEQANQAKSRYISNISHELRTPLNSILGYAQILEQDTSLPSNRRQAVSVIRRSGDHLLSLIEGSLDLAQIEAGRLQLDMKPMRFDDFLQQIVDMFQLQAQQKGLFFRYQKLGVLPLAVRADKRRLGQILINLLGNAIKFTTRGQVQFQVSYIRQLAYFEIRDSGPGISTDEMARIFEPFARGQTQAGGTGLGLTISKMLVELMGGELTVTSQSGLGSCFVVRLFLPEIASQDLDSLTKSQHQYIGYLGKPKRVLIVDNQLIERDLLACILTPLGFEVEQADSGEACLGLLPHQSYDLILLDLAMPGIDGWETLRRIRAEKLSDAHVMIVSANAYDRSLGNDLGVELADFVVKPVQYDELIQRIGEVLKLEWLDSIEPKKNVTSINFIYPSIAELQSLEEHLSLGYIRGVLQHLQHLEQQGEAYLPFVFHARELVATFNLAALRQFIEEGYQLAKHG